MHNLELSRQSPIAEPEHDDFWFCQLYSVPKIKLNDILGNRVPLKEISTDIHTARCLLDLVGPSLSGNKFFPIF